MRILGVINIESPDVGAFSEEDQATIERLATAAGLALDNVQRHEHLTAVLEASSAMVKPYGLDATLKGVLDAAQTVAVGISAMTIWYKKPGTGIVTLGPHFGVHYPEDMNKHPISPNSVVSQIMNRDEHVMATNVHDYSFLIRFYVEKEAICSVAAFPLRVDNEVVGAMFFNYREKHVFSREEHVLFPLFAMLAADSIRDATKLEEIRKERDRLDMSRRITEAVGTSLDQDVTLNRVMKIISTTYPESRCAVLLYNKDEHVLEFTSASEAYYKTSVVPDNRLMVAEGEKKGSIVARIARESLRTGQVAIQNVGDVEKDDDYLEVNDKIRSEIGVSLMDGTTLLGVLALEAPKYNAFKEEDVAQILSIGQSVSIAISRSLQSADLQYQTTVATRTAWAAEIAHDINQEIKYIRTRAYFLKNGKGRASDAEEIDESAERLFALTTAPFSSIPANVEIDKWLREQVIARLQGRDIKVTFDLNCGSTTTFVSPYLLERVIRHLVRNAMEAMLGVAEDSNSKALEHVLTVRSELQNRNIEIQFIDNGPGIDPDDLPKLLNVPHTTKGKDRGDGGLGLMFVRSAIEQIGGTIRVLPSPLGHGATFVFTVPLVHDIHIMEAL